MNDAWATKIIEQCPNLNRCNSSTCPLDMNEKDRVRLSGEDKCIATKQVRLRIGLKSLLPRKGLTVQEYNGILQYCNSIEEYAREKYGL